MRTTLFNQSHFNAFLQFLSLSSSLESLELLPINQKSMVYRLLLDIAVPLKIFVFYHTCVCVFVCVCERACEFSSSTAFGIINEFYIRYDKRFLNLYKHFTHTHTCSEWKPIQRKKRKFNFAITLCKHISNE